MTAAAETESQEQCALEPISNDKLYAKLLDVQCAIEEIVEFVNMLQGAVANATTAGGMAGMMARNMFPAELAPPQFQQRG